MRGFDSTRRRRRKVVDNRPEHIQALARAVQAEQNIVNDGGNLGSDAGLRAAQAAYDAAYKMWQADRMVAAMSVEACGDF